MSEGHVEVRVVNHGEEVAIIAPGVGEQTLRQWSQEAWERFLAMSEKISMYWPKGVTAGEAVKEQRREL